MVPQLKTKMDKFQRVMDVTFSFRKIVERTRAVGKNCKHFQNGDGLNDLL